jgi:hypothetical protein
MTDICLIVIIAIKLIKNGVFRLKMRPSEKCASLHFATCSQTKRALQRQIYDKKGEQE